MKKQYLMRVLPFLSAAVLTACGGGGGGGGGNGGVSTILNGVALKGPLNGAVACADINENGLCDDGAANQVVTNADGTFVLTLTKPVPILVVINSTTKDDRGNSLASGTMLKAPAGSTTVSVATTMLAAGASNDQVATALGYPAGTDFKTLNPFKAGGSNADQYKFETSAMQVYTAISAIASGASSSGANSYVAFDNAFKALADKAKVASSSINFSDPAEIDDIAGKTKVNMASVTGFDAAKFEAARVDLKAAVVNVNTKIKAVTEVNFNSADTNNLYGVATKSLSDQIGSRVKDDVPVSLADTANFDAVLMEQKKATSTTIAKVSDISGFWQGTLDGIATSALVSSDGVAWLVINDGVKRVVKTTLDASGGLLQGKGFAYSLGTAIKVPVAMTASLSNTKLTGSLTASGRQTYEFTAANVATYNTAATLSSFAKTWTSTASSGLNYSWSFSGAGVLSGFESLSGCTYSGKLALRSGEAKAITDANVVEVCSTGTTIFDGIAYINKDSQAVFVLTSTKGAVLLSF